MRFWLAVCGERFGIVAEATRCSGLATLAAELDIVRPQMTSLARFESVADKKSVPSLKAGVIVDTQVLIDFVFRTRRRHHAALRLIQFLQAEETPVLVPAHAVFEYQAAFQQASREKAAALAPQARARHVSSVILYPVSIDHAFVKASARIKLPYLRGGDLPFLALAAVLRRPLVTEDVALFKKAVELKLAVTSTEGFLKSMGA